jgi:hypothetical protein
MTPKTIERNTQEYKMLEAVAKLLETFSAKGFKYTVEDVYFDFGQDWMWTTIIAHNPEEFGVLHSWQAINPRQWEGIITSTNVNELTEMVNIIQNDNWFSDK